MTCKNPDPRKMRMMARGGAAFILAISVLISVYCGCQPLYAQSADFSPEKVHFTIGINGFEFQYNIMSIFVLPGEKLRLDIANADRHRPYAFESDDMAIEKSDSLTWIISSPAEKGCYVAFIIQSEPADTAILNIFVMVPYREYKGEFLNGYRIGKYPSIPLKQLPIYRPPAGFIEVTAEDQDLNLTPHFKLRQFLCKQDGDFPKYIVLREKLLLKLELILEKVNEKDYRCDTFNILSGYRTPYYNHQIGNVKYSRHLWGGAADIFIDENPKDDMMDDLSGDGKINWRDAEVLYSIIDELYGRPWYELFVGGLSWYKKTETHGPFVHVDVRGRRARWGN